MLQQGVGSTRYNTLWLCAYNSLHSYVNRRALIDTDQEPITRSVDLAVPPRDKFNSAIASEHEAASWLATS